MKHFISLGAGVQSSTMALMAKHGEITPMPEAAIFADTQAEPQVVYDWLDWLEKHLPFPVIRTVYKPELTVIEKVFADDFSQIPSYTTKGLGKRQCTKYWKILPVAKEIFNQFGRKKHCQWVGISRDEIRRMKPSRYKLLENRWPLIDAGMRRADCINWMHAHGYETPPRSACVFCPFQGPEEWNKNKNHPLTVAVEALCIERGEYLHASCLPLSQIDFRSDVERGQLLLWGNECEGMCGI